MCHAKLLLSDFCVGGKVSLFCRYFGRASKKLCFKSASKMCVFNKFFFLILLCNQIIETNKQTKNIAYYDAHVASLL